MLTPVETLMFLPGASGNTSLWKPLSERLALPAKRRFFAWPGFGGEPADRGVTGISDLGARVAAEIVAPTQLFAQSMGGIVAMLATLAKPELVRHLVLSVTSGGIDTSNLGAIDWRPEFRKHNPNLPTWFEQERWDLSARLAQIRIPVLLLWGDADPISPVAIGQRLQALLPNAELVVIPGGSHDLVDERVDDVLPHVERHLRKSAATPSAG